MFFSCQEFCNQKSHNIVSDHFNNHQSASRIILVYFSAANSFRFLAPMTSQSNLIKIENVADPEEQPQRQQQGSHGQQNQAGHVTTSTERYRQAHSSRTIDERLARVEKLNKALRNNFDEFVKTTQAQFAKINNKAKRVVAKKTTPSTSGTKIATTSQVRRDPSTTKSSKNGQQSNAQVGKTIHRDPPTERSGTQTIEVALQNHTVVIRTKTSKQRSNILNAVPTSRPRKRPGTTDISRRITVHKNENDFTHPVKQARRGGPQIRKDGCQLCGHFGHSEKASYCKYLPHAIMVLKERRKWYHYKEPNPTRVWCKICDGDHDLEECSLFGELSMDATLIAIETHKVEMVSKAYVDEHVR